MSDPEVLGANMAELFRTGKHVLPGAAAQLHVAYVNNPTYSSYVFRRSGPIGVGEDGPAQQWQELAQLLDEALLRNEEAMTKIGDWMVSYVRDLAATDAAAAAVFRRYTGQMGEG